SFEGPGTLAPNHLLFRVGEVGDDAEVVPDFLHGHLLDGVGHGLAGEVEQPRHVEERGCVGDVQQHVPVELHQLLVELLQRLHAPQPRQPACRRQYSTTLPSTGLVMLLGRGITCGLSLLPPTSESRFLSVPDWLAVAMSTVNSWPSWVLRTTFSSPPSASLVPSDMIDQGS
ncbi:unnamed protein product, partial [Musa textilis]